MSDLTGWDLSLSKAVTIEKNHITVSFAKTSALFAGPPEPQKEEFFVYDADTLIPTILDSVKKTLQENFAATCAGGAPDSLHIYYRMEGDQPLTFDNLHITDSNGSALYLHAQRINGLCRFLLDGHFVQ